MAYAEIFTFVWKIILLSICFIHSVVFVTQKKWFILQIWDFWSSVVDSYIF
jgi:hypothetical protein